MSKKLAEQRIDFNAPPRLTPAQEAELAALASRSEDEVDTTDIPELDESFWANAERGRFYRPVKESTTVRIDRDVLRWLRSQGRGYQTRINAILREAMLRDRPE